MLRDGQPLIRLPDPTKMQVVTTVNDSKINQVTVGMPVTIQLDTDSSLRYDARVAKVASFPLPRRWYQAPIEYEVWVEVLNPDEQTRPGLRAKVEILVEQLKDKIQAPVSSLVRRQDGYFVLVKNGNKIEARSVEIGPNNEKFIVIESGLSPGEEVLIDPDKYLENTDIKSDTEP
jgi:multidrug efflux pump subunit AcrA (membrane-fusion protein)